MADVTEVEVVPEVGAHSTARRARFNDANNSFCELSDPKEDSDLEEDEWMEDALDGEDKFGSARQEANEGATTKVREELSNNKEGDKNNSAVEEMYNSYAEEGGKVKKNDDNGNNDEYNYMLYLVSMSEG